MYYCIASFTPRLILEVLFKFKLGRSVPVMSCEPGRTKAYHSDLRWRMVYQRKVLDISTKKISENLCVDASTVQRIVNLFDTTGSVEKKVYISNAMKLSRAEQTSFTSLSLS